jgi:beta-glucosidase
VLVNGQLVVDNWTSPTPGEAFFGYASAEVVGTVELAAGTEAEVEVEWSVQSDSSPLAGLRFGWNEPVDEDQLLDDAVEAARGADAAVVVVGLNAEWETEGHDRVGYGFPGRQDELVRRVAAANPRTVVVVNAGGPIDLPWLDEVPAAVMAWYPGEAFGEALADVIFGTADPGGRLPVTFPTSLDRTPTADSIPGDGTTLHYRERLHVGHRWYGANDVEPRLPFGHGGSYATFEVGPARLQDASAGAAQRVTVPVTNTSERDGKCVVQLYLRPADPDRPRVLAGFAALRPGPGATVEATVDVDPRVLRRWDGDGWVTMTGDHQLDVALSSTDVVQTLPFSVAAR